MNSSGLEAERTSAAALTVLKVQRFGRPGSDQFYFEHSAGERRKRHSSRASSRQSSPLYGRVLVWRKAGRLVEGDSNRTR